MDEYRLLQLGALLHDIGKVIQRDLGRAEGGHSELGYNFLKGLDEDIALFAKFHQKSDIDRQRDEFDNLDIIKQNLLWMVCKADTLSSTERGEYRGEFNPKNPLISVFSKVKLNKEVKEERAYPLTTLSFGDFVFPGLKKDKVKDAINKDIKELDLIDLSCVLGVYLAKKRDELKTTPIRKILDRFNSIESNKDKFDKSELMKPILAYTAARNKPTGELVRILDNSISKVDSLEKFENVIDRITAQATPRQIERVPAGSKFNFEIIYTIEIKEQVEEDLGNINKIGLGKNPRTKRFVAKFPKTRRLTIEGLPLGWIRVRV